MFAKEADLSLVARGRDKTGKAWRAILPPALRGLWMTVQDGSRTYYFAGYTGAAGMAPDTWILALSFDDRGRPVPFYVSTRSAYDARGIKDLLNLDTDGPVLSSNPGWRRIGTTRRARAITLRLRIVSAAHIGIAPTGDAAARHFRSLKSGQSFKTLSPRSLPHRPCPASDWPTMAMTRKPGPRR